MCCELGSRSRSSAGPLGSTRFISTMHRLIAMIVFITLDAVTSAPREDSEITYVKIHPLIRDLLPSQPLKLASYRESRIENIPLQIKSFTLDQDVDHTYHDPYFPSPIEVIRKERSEEQTSLGPDSEPTTEKEIKDELRIKAEEEKNKPGLILNNIGPVFDKPIPGPKFYSKLSYYSQENEDENPLTNFITKFKSSSNKKKFKSRCRCERIWNCPILQISIPRCPEEYFLCCF